MNHQPCFDSYTINGITVHIDSELRERYGVVVAFSERGGGVSSHPYASLNLAYHVGDDPAAVDENRSRLWEALGFNHETAKFSSAEQVHGFAVARVAPDSGPDAISPGGVAARADALITDVPQAPLLLCYADCVPVVLVALGERPSVSVVHAGWRGVVGGIIDQALAAMVDSYTVDPSKVLAYIGPHIGPEEFVVSEDVGAVFEEALGKASLVFSGRNGTRVDLDVSVRESLARLGVQSCNIASMGACTARSTDRFFSYRAEQGVTGRHGAVGCILPTGGLS